MAKILTSICLLTAIVIGAVAAEDESLPPASKMSIAGEDGALLPSEASPEQITALFNTLPSGYTAEWEDIGVGSPIANRSREEELEDAKRIRNNELRVGNWPESQSPVEAHGAYRVAKQKYSPVTFGLIGRPGSPRVVYVPDDTSYGGFVLHDTPDHKVEGSWTHAFETKKLGTVYITEVNPALDHSSIRLKREFINAEINDLPAIMYTEKSRDSKGVKRVTTVTWIDSGIYYEALAEINGKSPSKVSALLTFLGSI